jgi:imidazoleglycerol phosphate dehydratase HisB
MKELERPGGAIHHVVDVALKFGVVFKDLQGRTLQFRRQISWANVAMNRTLWSCVVELGAMLG